MIEVEEIKDLHNDNCISRVIASAKSKIEKNLSEAVENLNIEFGNFSEELQKELERDDSKDDVDNFEQNVNEEDLVLPLSHDETKKKIEESGVGKIEKNEQIEKLMEGERQAEFDEFIRELNSNKSENDNDVLEIKRKPIKGKVYDFDPKKHGVR